MKFVHILSISSNFFIAKQSTISGMLYITRCYETILDALLIQRSQVRILLGAPCYNLMTWAFGLGHFYLSICFYEACPYLVHKRFQELIELSKKGSDQLPFIVLMLLSNLGCPIKSDVAGITAPGRITTPCIAASINS